MGKKQWFEWTVKVRVHRTWVEDGFDLQHPNCQDNMLNGALRCAYGHERSMKVVAVPDQAAVAEAQGYKTVAEMKKARQ